MADSLSFSSLGLGIDAGGTQTRWALAGADGAIVAEGALEGISALQLHTPEGRAALQNVLERLAGAVLQHARPRAIRAGITGFGGEPAPLQALLGERFGLAASAVAVSSDIEIAYLSYFAPGDGYLVYAGTGSIGAFIDEQGHFHRAGGRGVILDDGGGGYWMAREALRHLWRGEDEEPGRWKTSPLSSALVEQIGSSDWAASRQLIYASERGAPGVLALAVAASASADPVAADILRRAGIELARLARALTGRYGRRPIVLTGRAASLHPMIAAAMRAALPPDTLLTHASPAGDAAGHAHHAAARSAATLSPPN